MVMLKKNCPAGFLSELNLNAAKNTLIFYTSTAVNYFYYHLMMRYKSAVMAGGFLSAYPFELSFNTVPAFKLLHLEGPFNFLISATVVPCRFAISHNVSPDFAL